MPQRLEMLMDSRLSQDSRATVCERVNDTHDACRLHHFTPETQK